MSYEKVYTIDSPEVIAYKEANADVDDDAAIGAVQNIHTAVVNGSEIATPDSQKDVVGKIATMIQEWMIENPETNESIDVSGEPIA